MSAPGKPEKTPAQEAPQITHRGQKAMRISDDGTERTDESDLTLTDVAWLFVLGTAPFFALASILHWYDPSAVLATILVWYTGEPLAVALPLAIIGSLHHRRGGHIHD